MSSVRIGCKMDSRMGCVDSACTEATRSIACFARLMTFV